MAQGLGFKLSAQPAGSPPHQALETWGRWAQTSLISRDDAGADRPALGGGAEVALAENVKHHDGDLVVHAEGESGGVHHLETASEGVPVGNGLETLGPRVGAGIGIVDAVDLGGLEKGIGPDFTGPKGGGGVGGEEGMTGASGEDDHPTFFEVAEGPATDEGFGDVFHLDGGHDAGLDSGAFEGVLEGERVDDCGQHPHVVSGVAVHPAFAGGGGAAPDVSSSDDDGELEGGGENVADLVGEAAGDGLGEVIPGFGESFAGEFQQQPPAWLGPMAAFEGLGGIGSDKRGSRKFKGGATGDGVF